MSENVQKCVSVGECMSCENGSCDSGNTVRGSLTKLRGNERVMTLPPTCTGARAPLRCATLWWVANIPVALLLSESQKRRMQHHSAPPKAAGSLVTPGPNR